MTVFPLIGVLFGLFAGFMYAASTVTARIKLERDKIDVAVLYTLLVNNIIFITIILFKVIFTDFVFIFDVKAVGIMALSGLFGPFLGRTLLFASSERIGPSKASCIKILSPVFAAVLALVFLKELISWTGYVGILVVVLGLYWLYIDNNDSIVNYTQLESRSAQLGTYMAYGCAFAYSLSYVLRKSGVTIYPYPLEAAAIEVFFALIFYLTYFILTGKIKNIVETPKISIKYFLYSGIAGSFGIFSYYFALQFIPATIGATLISTQAFFAILLSALFKGNKERITRKLIIGSIFIFIGVALTVLF